MKYVKKKLTEIRPYDNNPRIIDDAVDDVVESIRQCSYIAPIIVDEDGVILAGHTRYKALQKLGYKEPDNRPSYVQHWFERVTTTCPSCGQSVTYNSTSDNFFINGKLDHTENYGGGYVCPFCGYRSW